MNFLRLLLTALSLFSEKALGLLKTENGVPLYKSPPTVAGAVSAVLEGVGTVAGFPGVGSAIGVITGAVISKVTDTKSQTVNKPE